MPDVKEEVDVDVVLGQLLSKEHFNVKAKCLGSTHHESGQISLMFLLFGAVHNQRPIVVIRVDHISVVNAFIYQNVFVQNQSMNNCGIVSVYSHTSSA